MAVGLRLLRVAIRLHRRRRGVAAVSVSHQRRVRQVLRRRGLVRRRPGVDAQPLAQDGGVGAGDSPVFSGGAFTYFNLSFVSLVSLKISEALFKDAKGFLISWTRSVENVSACEILF